MPRYIVTLPVLGTAVYEVEAADEDAAIEEALKLPVTEERIDSLQTVHHVMEGNVFQGDYDEAEAEEV